MTTTTEIRSYWAQPDESFKIRCEQRYGVVYDDLSTWRRATVICTYSWAGGESTGREQYDNFFWNYYCCGHCLDKLRAHILKFGGYFTEKDDPFQCVHIPYRFMSDTDRAQVDEQEAAEYRAKVSDNYELSDNEDMGWQPQGKNARGKSYTSRRIKRITENNFVYDFGKHYDLKEHADVADLLRNIDEWLWKTRMPQDVVHLRNFSASWASQSHRKMALHVLMSQGHPIAKLMLSAMTGKLSQKRRNAWNVNQPQYLDTMIELAWLFMTVFVAMKAYKYRGEIKNIYNSLGTLNESMIRATDKVARASDTAIPMMGKIMDVADTVMDACNSTYSYFEELVHSISRKFIGLSQIVQSFATGLITCLLVFMAFEFARTVFPKYYCEIRLWICDKLGYTDVPSKYDSFEAQGAGDEEEPSILEDIMSFFAQNFVKKPKRFFLEYLGDVPKLVSIAKGLEWCFEHLGFLYNVVIECITVQPRPRTRLESEILSFSILVTELTHDMKMFTAEEIFSELTSIKFANLDIEKARLETLTTKTEKLRPVFISRFLQSAMELEKLKGAYKVQKRMAIPRPVPVFVYIWGEPGVGKSTILPVLYRGIWNYIMEYGNLVEGEFHNGHLYYLNQKEEFFDGYTGQCFTVIDDLFQSKDPDDRAMNAHRLIHMISPEPYSLRVATVEEKAHCFFTSKCVVATSNMPPHFGGKNVGLTDPSALSTRITVAVKMDRNGRFKVDNSICQVHKTPGVVEDFISVEDLIALIGESMLQREKEKNIPPPNLRVPRFIGKLNSARLKFESQGLGDEKGKEKITENEVRDLALAQMAYQAALNHGVISEKARLCAKMLSDKFEEGPFLLHEYGYDKLVKNVPVRMAGESEGRYMRRLEHQLFFETYVELCDNEVLAKMRLTGLDMDLIENYDAFKARLDKEYVRQSLLRRNLKEDRWKKEQRNRTPAKTWKERLSDPITTVKEFVKGIAWLYSKKSDSRFADVSAYYTLGQSNPECILLCPDKKRPTSMKEWCEAHHSAYNAEYWVEEDAIDYDFWDPIAERLGDYWDSHPMAPGNFEARYQAADARVPIMTILTMGVVMWMGIGYMVTRLLFMIMPKTAHENKTQAQAAYPTDGSGKTKRSKPAIKRTQRRASKRDRDSRPGKKTFVPQGKNELADKIANNADIIEVRISEEDDKWDEVKLQPPVASCYVLFTHSNYALVPGHVMFSKGEGKKRWYSLVRNQNYVTTEDELDFIKELRGDVFLVRFKDLQERRNILGLFADKVDDFGRFNHLVPHILDSGHDMCQAWSWDNEFETVFVDNEYGSFETDLRFMGIPNEKGLCGTPYVHSSTNKIVGIHMGGSPSQQISLAVSCLKDDLVPYWDAQGIMDPIPHILGQAQGMSGVQVIGRLPPHAGSFVPTKTALRESKFDYKSLPIPETEDGPAHLLPFEKDGVRISPLKTALEKFAQQERVPNPKPPKSIFDCLPKSFNPKNVKAVSIEDAIYGIPGYMKSIDFDTSSGYFFKKLGLSRRALCFDENGEKRIHPLLRAEVEKRLEFAKRGIQFPVVFEETLKDEIRSKEKNDKGETRLFSAGDFASFVIQRMYLGTFFVEFTKDPIGSPVGLGINPHSSDWGRLYSRLRGRPHEKRRVGAGDFRNYDISLQNMLMELFCKLVSRYFDGIDVIVVVILIKNNFSGWHIVGVFVFLRPKGTCSGSFITAMFNTFANWCLHKIAFIAIYSEEEWVVVETTFTGDDSVFTTPDEYSEYNMEYLQKYFHEHFAMNYTSPTKTSKMTVDWSELQYLKRNFVEGHMGIMAPLAKRSLANMIKWTDTDQDRIVLQSVVSSLLLEAWHYGEEFYNECYAWCQVESRRLGISFDLNTFEDMNALRAEDY